MNSNRPISIVEIYMSRLLQEFGEDVTTQIEGMTSDLATDELSAGAKINRLFYTEFLDTLSLVQVMTDFDINSKWIHICKLRKYFEYILLC